MNWFIKMNKVSIISKTINFTKLYSMIKITDIYMKDKSGPRTEPYGTPYFIEALLEIWPLIETKLFSVKEVGFKPFICNTTYFIMFKSFLQINKNTTTNISFIYVLPNIFSKTYQGMKSEILLSKTKLQWINEIIFSNKM